jgi:hypothetical protein
MRDISDTSNRPSSVNPPPPKKARPLPAPVLRMPCQSAPHTPPPKERDPSLPRYYACHARVPRIHTRTYTHTSNTYTHRNTRKHRHQRLTQKINTLRNLLALPLMPTITRELVISTSRCSAFSPGGGSIYMLTYSSIRQHTSAYVSIRQHTSAYASYVAYVSIRQHTSAYVSIRQHSSAYVSIRQHTSAYAAYVSICSIRQHTSAYVSIRQHTQHTYMFTYCQNKRSSVSSRAM